jgi:hypothetical protein
MILDKIIISTKIHSFAVIQSISDNFHRVLVDLPTTFWRLCEGGASTTVHAGYKRSFSHCLFCGVIAPLSQNRSLYAGLF